MSENEETTEERSQAPRVHIGLSELGAIQLDVENGPAIFGPEEAFKVAGHLNALGSMLIQMAYAREQMEREAIAEMLQGKKGIYVPGS